MLFEQRFQSLEFLVGRVWLPDAIDRKFPVASRDWRWQWVFPAPTRWKSETTEGRHHYHETNVQRAVTRAVRAAGIEKRVVTPSVIRSPPTFWNADPTSALSMSYSVTGRWPRP